MQRRERWWVESTLSAVVPVGSETQRSGERSAAVCTTTRGRAEESRASTADESVKSSFWIEPAAREKPVHTPLPLNQLSPSGQREDGDMPVPTTFHPAFSKAFTVHIILHQQFPSPVPFSPDDQPHCLPNCPVAPVITTVFCSCCWSDIVSSFGWLGYEGTFVCHFGGRIVGMVNDVEPSITINMRDSLRTHTI